MQTIPNNRSAEAHSAEPLGPLAGLIVVDLSRALAGPHAGQMFGDLGARVIKVEMPGVGDETRSWGPPFVDGSDGAPVSTYFLSCNRNKQSIALDFKEARDFTTLLQLIRSSDVLIENFRGGVMERLGLGPVNLARVNPALIQLSITGFGQDGPEGSRAGYDQIVQGEAGLMSLTGSGPGDVQRVGVPIADVLSGIHGVTGVLAALHERTTTGRGKVVRTSLLASVVSAHAFQGTRVTVASETPAPQGNHHPSLAPYGLFACQDGSVQVAVGNERLWTAFCAEFGLDPLAPGLSTNAERVANREVTINVVERVFGSLEATEILGRLDSAGIPAGKVRSLPEVYSWDQVHAQGLIVDTDHATLGKVSLPGPPLRFFDVDGRGESERTRIAHSAPPLLNEHDEVVRTWLATHANP